MSKAHAGQSIHVPLPVPVFATTSALAIQRAGTPSMTKYSARFPQDTQPCSAADRVHTSVQGLLEEHGMELPSSLPEALSNSQKQSVASAGQGHGMQGLRTEQRVQLPQSPHFEVLFEGQKDHCLGPLLTQPAQQLSGSSGGVTAHLLQTGIPSGHSDTRRRTPQH